MFPEFCHAAQRAETGPPPVDRIRKIRLEKSRGASRGADLGLFLEAGASGNGRDEEDAVAFLETAGFAAEEADVFFVEIDV